MKKGGLPKWDIFNLRKHAGTNVMEIKDMEERGELNPHMTNLDQELEYFQGKFHFSQREINYYKDVFGFFEKANTETCYTSDLGLAMRAGGILVTELEVMTLTKRIDPYRKGTIDFNDYQMCVYQMSQKDTSESKIKDCLGPLDKDGNGYINQRELRHLVTKFGECLTEKEIEAFMEYFTILPNNCIRLDDVVDVLRFEPNTYISDP